MNAYKLASFLEADSWYKLVSRYEIVDMLRQQADRIAELEKSHIELEKGILKKLNQEMMSKPVAWIVEEDEDESWTIYQNPKWAEEHAKNMQAKIIPLYTHTVKQLSDEEIANIWAEHTKVAGTYDVKDIIFPFARALIKEITQ